ncbi:putative Ig domain-containing protein [Mesorhizobium sp. SP-1A]|uniref:putative Ig domain-containing protein n=1 Tax=Mesorhizobium sp. SP-1A TaxID=3077840 RepID=UPI0028F6F177|nr:putative Ig domain-containing protein [Mesorhizobium sp. SP-1A]
MNRNFYSKIIASMMVLSTTAAHAEPVYMFRMTSGMTKVSEITEDITLNFSPSAYYVDDSVSLSGLIKSGDSIALESDSGALPPGLSLQGSSIVGIATTAGTYSNIKFRVTNSKGASKVFGPYSMQVVAPVHLSVLPQQVSAYTNYSNTLSASGGVAPYTFAVVGGTLPNGLTLSASGVLSGAAGAINTPTELQDVTIQVTDSNGRTASVIMPIVVVEPLSIVIDDDSTNKISYIGEAHTWSFKTTGGVEPVRLTYRLLGNPPDGMTIQVVNDSKVVVSGTPQQVRGFGIELEATDSALFPRTRTNPYEWLYTYNLPAIYTTSIEGVRGQPLVYGHLSVSGGVYPYSFELTAPDGKPLPDGLSLDAAAGQISGTPTESFSKSVTLTVTDAGGKTASRTVEIKIETPLEIVVPSSITYYVGETVTWADAVRPQVEGGKYFYMFDIEVDGGSLPAGLNFNAIDGSIVGTPTEEGPFKFRFVVTDLSTNTRYYSSEVLASVEQRAAQPAFQVKLPESMTFKLDQAVDVRSEITVRSGDPRTGWYLYNLEVNGVMDGKALLPAGLSSSLPYSNFANIGIIYGTARQTGVYKIRVLATDQYENRESHFSNEMTLTIEP